MTDFLFKIPHNNVQADNALKTLVKVAPSAGSGAIAAVAKANIHAHIPTSQPEPERLPLDIIQKYSLLDQQVSITLGRKLQAATAYTPSQLIKMGVNFAAGGLMTGEKGLDALTSDVNFSVWLALMQDLYQQMPKGSQEDGIVKNLISGLEKLQSHAQTLEGLRALDTTSEVRYNAIMPFAERLKNLKSGQTEPFYIGYNNDGAAETTGHAQILDVTRREDGALDVKFYTSTYFQLADTLPTETKTLLFPVVPYDKIPEKALLFNDDNKTRPGFVASLAELRVALDDNHRYSDDDVVQILDNLEKARNPNGTIRMGAITGQRGGTCMPSVTKVWLRHHCHHRFLYKQIMFQCKLKLLASLHASLAHTLNKDDEIGAKARTLLRQLALNLYRRVPKMLQEKLMDVNAAKQANATAQDILQRVEEAEAFVKQEQAKNTVDSDLSKAKVQNQRENREKFNHDTKTVFRDAHPQPVSLPDFTIRIDLNNDCADSLLKAITDTEMTCDRLGQSAYAMQVEHLLDQIPLPVAKTATHPNDFKVNAFTSPYWDNFTLDQLCKVQRRLYEFVSKRYFAFNFQEPLPRHFASTLPLHVLFHFLSLKIEAKKIQDLPKEKDGLIESYPMPDLTKVLELEGLQFYNRHEFERVKAAAVYVKTFNAPISGNSTLFDAEKGTKVELKDTLQYKANGQFFHALCALDTQVRLDQLQKAKPGKKVELPPGEITLSTLVKEQGEKDFKDFTVPEIEAAFKKMQDDIADWHADKKIYDDQYKDYQLTEDYKWRFRVWEYSGKTGTAPQPPTKKVDRRPFIRAEPPKAETLKNLPAHTKGTLVMSAFNSETWDQHVLTRGDYSYVNILRHMTYACRIALFQGPSDIRLNQVAKRLSDYNKESALEGAYHSDNPSHELAESVWKTHRPMGNHVAFRNLPIASRLEKNWGKPKAEGNVLKEKWEKAQAASPAPDPKNAHAQALIEGLQNRLARTLSQWELAPHQIMYELQQEFKQLQDPSLQSVLMQLLFRSPVLDKVGDPNYNALQLGFGQLIVDNTALFDTAKTFINKGFFHGSSFDETINTGRFFFEFSFHLCKYLSDAGIKDKAASINQIEELKRWIKEKKNLSDQALSTLYLYLVCFYSLKPNLSEEEKAHLYACWILYKMNPPMDGKWRSPFIESWAERFIKKSFSEHSCKDLGSKIFAHLNVGLDNAPGAWRIDFALGYPYLTNGEWKLNLDEGKVYNNEGELRGVSGDFPWEKEDAFERLFGTERGFSYRSVNNSYIFTHPTRGSFRIVQSYYGKNNYRIQKKILGFEEWFEYCPRKELEQCFPNALNDDHAYWVPTRRDIELPYSTKGFITPLRSSKVLYVHVDGGEIIEADPQTGEPKVDGQRFDYLSTLDSSLDGLSRFDALQNILTSRKRDGTLTKLCFSRYTSLDSNPLTFILINGRNVLLGNHDFAIPNKMPQKLLGTIENFIFLESVNDPKPDSGLLLVPLQKNYYSEKTNGDRGWKVGHRK